MRIIAQIQSAGLRPERLFSRVRPAVDRAEGRALASRLEQSPRVEEETE